MSQRRWFIEVDGKRVHYGHRTTALVGAMRYARMRPKTYIPVFHYREGAIRLFTRARWDGAPLWSQ